MFSYVAALVAVLSFSQCAEDAVVDNYSPAEIGDEVVFGARASMENGNQKTRTQYGDPVNGIIPLQWVNNKDIIEIVSPESPTKKGVYMVTGATNNSADGSSSTSTLVRQGEYGIQWGSNQMHFYAIYPAPAMFKNETGDIKDPGLRFGPNSLVGFMPTEILLDKTYTVSNGACKIEPDMRYAFMYADTVMTRDEANLAGGVSLDFLPIVSALQFHIIAPKIDNQNSEIEVKGVSIISKQGKAFAGDFTCDTQNRVIHIQNPSARIQKTFQNPVKLKTGEELDITFFVLPVGEIPSGDLQLQIQYKIPGNDLPFVKKASFKNVMNTIGKNNGGKKYEFKNITLPDIKNADVSNWFAGIHNKALISQVSIPVAGHAFSQYYNGTDKAYKREQVLDYKTLWKRGVRGFEMRIANNENQLEYNFGDSKFICSGAELSGAGTFATAFNYLCGELKNTPSETLVLILTYQSYGGSGFSPNKFLRGLKNFLNSSASTIAADRFVKLGTTSTAGDIRGKVAIVLRVADDANTNISVNPSELGPWADKVAFVKDWGTAVDNWDKRYGSAWAREGAFTTDQSKQIERYLIKCKESVNSKDFKDVAGWSRVTAPKPAPNYNYNNGNAMIQCWERVIPDSSTKTYKTNQTRTEGTWWNEKTYTLHLEWQSSLQEKKDAIEKVFQASKELRGTNTAKLFINCLSGYFAVDDAELVGSAIPYVNGGDHPDGYSTFLQTTGGDYKSCAAELNSHTYDYLSQFTSQTTGPWGLVMFDYIGASTTDFSGLKNVSATVNSESAARKSSELLDLIIFNNFRFPLTLSTDNPAPSQVGEQGDMPLNVEGDGNAISFE